ncbi:hypothetical protein C8R47DRAFT_1072355 [Mycena vitilis]|nr:hypothetical protein C8R47DRAFT_1072355 [Mycena vitilis]
MTRFGRWWSLWRAKNVEQVIGAGGLAVRPRLDMEVMDARVFSGGGATVNCSHSGRTGFLSVGDRTNSGMRGTGGGGEEMVGLAGGERYGTANERVRVWPRLKLEPDGEEGARLLGVGGTEKADRAALFGVWGCLRSPQERMAASLRWDVGFGRWSVLWRLRWGLRDWRRRGGGREARTTSGDGLRGGGESGRAKKDMVDNRENNGRSPNPFPTEPTLSAFLLPEQSAIGIEPTTLRQARKASVPFPAVLAYCTSANPNVNAERAPTPSVINTAFAPLTRLRCADRFTTEIPLAVVEKLTYQREVPAPHLWPVRSLVKFRAQRRVGYPVLAGPACRGVKLTPRPQECVLGRADERYSERSCVSAHVWHKGPSGLRSAQMHTRKTKTKTIEFEQFEPQTLHGGGPGSGLGQLKVLRGVRETPTGQGRRSI